MKSQKNVAEVHGLEDRLLSETQAAEFLGMAAISLRMNRCRGQKPGGLPLIPYYKLGKSVRYSLADLREVIAASRVEAGR